MAAAWTSSASAQDNTTNTTNVLSIVGGVSVDAAGMVKNAERDTSGNLRQFHLVALQAIPEGMNQTAGLRKVSLRRLEAEIKKCLEAGTMLPDAVCLLGGLLEIRYVLVYPEERDIVLVGPAEGWVLDPRGYFVGAKSGRPVLLMDDLLVVLRAAIHSPSVLSCSINPTPEGIRRVEAFSRQLKPGVDARAASAAIEEQLGPQRITVNGVPDSTHFARVMVAADYRMKRISMGLEPAPIRGLPSYMEMIKGGGSGLSNMLPRWWLQPDYQPLLRDDAGLAWEIRGAAVRCMTENDYLDANGVPRPSGRTDPVTQRWADLMTSRYQDLAQADPVFAQLRGCMDLAVVSALIVKQRLASKAGHDFAVLTGAAEGLSTLKIDAPKQVATGATLARKGKKTMIAAGGVQMNPWTLVDKAEKSAEVAKVLGKASGAQRTTWWWD
jgi:hypothetical protein